MAPAHGHLKPVARRVEDYQNEILRRLLYSPLGGPMPCLLFLSLVAPMGPIVAVGWPCSWKPGGVDAAGGPSSGGSVALVAAAHNGRGYVVAPGLGATQEPWCSREACACLHSTQPCKMAVLLKALAPAWYVHTVGCMVRSPLGVCLQKLYGEVLKAHGTVMAWAGGLVGMSLLG